VRRKKEGEREREREKSVQPRRWTPRVSPRRCNGKSAAAGVRWTHSLSLARPAAQPSSSTTSVYVLRLHMHVNEKRETRGTPIHAGLRRPIITERIVITFFASAVIRKPVAHDGSASQRLGPWDAANGKGEEEDDDDDDDDEEDVGLLRREAEHAIASSWHKRAMRCSVEAGYLFLGNWVARPPESSVSSWLFFQSHEKRVYDYITLLM